MAGTIELLKSIAARLLHYPFFTELADANIELFPDDEAVVAATDRICASMGLSQSDIQARWIAETSTWQDILAVHGVPRVLDDEATKALAEEWVDLVKATCADLNESEREALDSLRKGIVSFTWLGFEDGEPQDQFIVIHFHLGNEVYVLWAENPCRGSAGHNVE